MTPNPLYDAEEYENRQEEAQATFEAELETLVKLALENPSLLSPCSNDEGFIELARWASTVTPTPQPLLEILDDYARSVLGARR